MPRRGEHSARLLLWLRRQDEVEFSDRLHAAIGAKAIWRKIMPGLQESVSGDVAADLLTSEGNGARMQLKAGGPIIQYLGSWLIRNRPAIGVLTAHG